jgi:hypothetical protein
VRYEEHHILACQRIIDVGGIELLVQRRCCTGRGSDEETKATADIDDLVAAHPRSRDYPVSATLCISSEGQITR